MVGPYGDWLNFPYDSYVSLIPEADCLRIVTSDVCDILQRLPAATEAIEHIGSTDPAALLYDASKAYEEEDPKSDENVRCLATAGSNQLEDAVNACINAAAAEFDITRQQSFLKAASYGKAFCADFDPEPFVDTAHSLRILNDIRRLAIGMPLTIAQYRRITPEVVVIRLTNRGHHLLAIKICELLRLKKDRVLLHWATEKIKKMVIITKNTDEEIRDVIKQKLNQFEKISYLEISATAFNIGRRRLATMLLDLESNPADQVPLLLSMNEGELALQKAVNSEDTDLIYLTLFHLEKNKVDQEAFYRYVFQHFEAANLLKMYYRHRMTSDDQHQIQSLLSYSKNYLESGITTFNYAYLQSNFSVKLQ
jgi:hypothetical protein